MAENNEFSPRQSLYGHTIQQASGDNGTVTASESPLSTSLPAFSSFGSQFRLKCGICLQDLKQPKQLFTCYHIFCKDCLQASVEAATGEMVTCPLDLCGKRCPKEDISKALSSDTYLHAFHGLVSVYAESGDVSCSDESHEEPEQAAYFCLECGQNFCETCHSSHSDADAFKHHHCLKLFKTPGTMTVGINRENESLLARSVDERDLSISYKCPICRNTDRCEHENWLEDLLDDSFRKNDRCSIPEHANGNELIAYCTKCDEAICRNCSWINHKNHITINIGEATKEKETELKSFKKTLLFEQEMFKDAASECDKAEANFHQHVMQVERDMIDRKGSMHSEVEKAFNVAFNLIEQTGQKQAELNRQSGEMHQEDQFLKTLIELAEKVLEGGASAVEMVRTWTGIKVILEDLGGERKKSSRDPEVVIPQDIVEKRLVLPTPSCMNPDLRILQKVGVESTVLHQAFVLKAEDELFQFYSILPLTLTEALVSCEPRVCATSVVQYSNCFPQRYSVPLADGGQCSIIAVPGNGIMATLYQASGSSCGDQQEKKQVLFWDQALDISMTEQEALGVRDKLKLVTETDLPPRGMAVTKDNHLVVCTAKDPPKDPREDPGESRILVMTMRGDILRETRLTPSDGGLGSGPYFPRYVTVNINGDICVTDEKDKSVIIFSSRLENKLRIINPYEKEELNRNFSPRGICHDSFGRLIVADTNNSTILRIEYDDAEPEPLFQVILKKGMNKLKDFDYPTLVEIGPGPRLWVVCRTNIHVFYYMDKE